MQSAKPGAKTVGLNIGVQVSLFHTSLSNSGLNALLLAMNIPSPSFSSIQNSATKVRDRIEAENREDLEKIRSFVKEGNKARGLPDSSPISVSTDATYNNRPCSRKTPYQAGTQVTQVVTEKSTNQQSIIDINNKSKLCQTARLLENKLQRPVDCPGHTGHCSANLPPDAIIGNEKKWFKESLESITRSGIGIKYITSDPDASSYKAAEDLFKAGILATVLEHQLDTAISQTPKESLFRANHSVIQCLAQPTRCKKLK